MQDQVNVTPAPKRVPWNKGKLTGAKPPLRPKHVWSIRTKLQIEGFVVVMFRPSDRGCRRKWVRGRRLSKDPTANGPASCCSPAIAVVTAHDNPRKCPSRLRMDWQHWTGPETVWDTFAATHEGYPDLSTHRQSQGRPPSARTYKNREHRSTISA